MSQPTKVARRLRKKARAKQVQNPAIRPLQKNRPAALPSNPARAALVRAKKNRTARRTAENLRIQAIRARARRKRSRRMEARLAKIRRKGPVLAVRARRPAVASLASSLGMQIRRNRPTIWPIKRIWITRAVKLNWPWSTCVNNWPRRSPSCSNDSVGRRTTHVDFSNVGNKCANRRAKREPIVRLQENALKTPYAAWVCVHAAPN